MNQMNNVCRTRTFTVFAVFILAYTALALNLYWIQIVNGQYYAQLAYNQHNITVTTMPPRADILDIKNSPLTLNKESFSAFVLPHKIEDPQKLKSFLKKYFPNSLARLKDSKNKFFMYIKRKLTKHEIELIEKNEIKDIKILKEPSRYYPFASIGTIIGITDIDNNGLFGIEKEFNTQLAGTPTTFTLEKDARSGHFYFQKNIAISGNNSNSIKLTIDKDLQFLAYEELRETVNNFGAKEGAVVIMDPSNGNILAMVSFPEFDPNDTAAINLELTKNRAFTNSYELGSVMKIFVAIAALEEGVVKTDELIDCENKKETKIDGMSFTTVHEAGVIPFSEVLEKSNNIGMVKVAKRLGPKLYDHYLKFGFGKKTNIPLSGEPKGFVSHPKNWSKRSIISLSFGYEITATLLQLAKAFCIIANDGYDVQPKLIVNNQEQKQLNRLYSQKTIDEVKQILHNTVTKGTAKKADIKNYKVMGKTGTANLAINGKYSKEKNLYTFAGIIEKDNYKRVIAVLIKEIQPQAQKTYAAMVAAPLFEHVAEKLLIHDKVI